MEGGGGGDNLYGRVVQWKPKVMWELPERQLNKLDHEKQNSSLDETNTSLCGGKPGAS